MRSVWGTLEQRAAGAEGVTSAYIRLLDEQGAINSREGAIWVRNDVATSAASPESVGKGTESRELRSSFCYWERAWTIFKYCHLIWSSIQTPNCFSRATGNQFET